MHVEAARFKSAGEGLPDRHANRQRHKYEVGDKARPAAPVALQAGSETEVRANGEGGHQQRPQQGRLPKLPTPRGSKVEDRFGENEAREWRSQQPQQAVPRQPGLAGSWSPVAS